MAKYLTTSISNLFFLNQVISKKVKNYKDNGIIIKILMEYSAKIKQRKIK